MTDEQKSYEVAKIEEKGLVKFSMDTGLQPIDFDGLWRVAKMIEASGMSPKGDTASAIATKIQFGAELGLRSIMASIQNIAVINGKPQIWGDVPLGIVQASGQLEDFNETEFGEYPKPTYGWVCFVKRKGNRPVERKFTVADAIDAGLWIRHKQSPSKEEQYTPWFKYPKRMLQMRARSWALRDTFPDKLKGIFISEEQVGIIDLEPQKNGSFSVAQEKTEEKAAVLKEKIKTEKKKKESPIPEQEESDMTPRTQIRMKIIEDFDKEIIQKAEKELGISINSPTEDALSRLLDKCLALSEENA